jgi:hypothetical protein
MKSEIIIAIGGMLFSISSLVRRNGNIFLSLALLQAFVIKILDYRPQSRCTRLAGLARGVHEEHMPKPDLRDHGSRCRKGSHIGRQGIRDTGELSLQREKFEQPPVGHMKLDMCGMTRPLKIRRKKIIFAQPGQ